MNSSFTRRRHGTMFSNKSRFARSPLLPRFKGLIKVGERGTFFVKDITSTLSGIGRRRVTLDRGVLGRFLWWLGGCPWPVGWGGSWLGGVGGLSLVGSLVACVVYVAVCSRPRGSASPRWGRVLLVFNSWFGVGRLTFCLKNKLKNDIGFKVKEVKKLMGLKVHHDDFKPTNSLEWQSVVASVR